MGEEFYCILKLSSGEEIFALISIDEDSDNEKLIILQNPVIMKIINNYKGTYIKVKPWIELSNESFFIIRLNNVITMTESKDEKLIGIYNNYMHEECDTSVEARDKSRSGGKVDLSKEMGYVDSVEESRKKLENLYKDLKES
jgi:hypothetical protein